jgi:hypothetical protein
MTASDAKMSQAVPAATGNIDQIGEAFDPLGEPPAPAIAGHKDDRRIASKVGTKESSVWNKCNIAATVGDRFQRAFASLDN